MEQFPPILLRAFGDRWFETGSLSCYFRNATTGGEPVRTLAQLPASGTTDAQVKVWMERDDGTQVLEGTASVGSVADQTLLHIKLGEPREPGEQRMLGHLPLGDLGPPVAVRLDLAERASTARFKVITEPLDWYAGPSPWGGPILNPGLVVHLMVQAQRRMDLARTKAVGLYGAIEVRHLRGPVFASRDYEVTGRIVAVGQTPKTEYLWYETLLREPAGSDVASMLMMLRFMKASSPLWQP